MCSFRIEVGIEQRILEKLEQWQKEEGTLPEILELYRDLLLAQIEARSRIPSSKPRVTQTEIAAKIRQGIPLLKWGALSIDWAVAQDAFRAAAEGISRHTDSGARGLANLASDLPTLQDVARAWYEGLPLSRRKGRYRVKVNPLSVAIHCAIKPFLSAQAEALIDKVPQDQWRRGHCPICGGKPDLAYLARDAGARWLICSRCDTEWLYQRLQCPYCENQNHELLAYFPDESGTYRLYVCNKCHTYLKAVDLRNAKTDTLLPLERVLTADLDRQGHEKGYRPGWAGRR